MKNRIRVLRAEKKISQADLADLTGVSRQAINAIENGKHEPSLSLGFKISQALNININDLFQTDTDIKS